MKCRPIFVLAIALAMGPVSAFAQGSRADYERAAGTGERFRGAMREANVRPEWVSPSAFWYRGAAPGGEWRYWLVDAKAGSRAPLFDHEKFAAAVKRITGKEVPAARLPIERIAMDGGALVLLLRDEARMLRYDPAKDEMTVVEPGEGDAFKLRPRRAARPSRDGGGDTSITFVNKSGGAVRMFWVDGGGERRPYARLAPGESQAQHTFAGHVWVAVTEDGKDAAVFEAGDRAMVAEIGGNAGPASDAAKQESAPAAAPAAPRAFIKDHNVFVEFPGAAEAVALSTDGTAADAYGPVFISPDQSKLVAIKTKRGGDRKVTYVESTPKDGVQPKLHDYEYLKPGDEWPVARPRLFDLATRREIPVSEEMLPTPWALDEFRWEADSSRFTFLYNQRGHRVMRVLAIDAASGGVSAVVNEECPTFFDYAAKTYLHFTKDSGEVIWMSERDGWNHLYLIDAKSGAVKNQITKGEWVVRSVDRVDEASRQIWFRAGGIRAGQDPYYIHYARVNFDGTGLTILTEGDGTHDVTASPEGDFLIDTYSRADLPPVTELRRASDGSLVLPLERADSAGLVEAGWVAPERFSAKGRDGQTEIYGLIHRPTNFDAKKKYPVIEAIYAGPHGQHVPKSFRVGSGVGQLTELGFIVVQIDGMGTNWRSKKFHDVAWKNLKDAGFPDRIAWLKAAAAAHPEMDLKNGGRGVGIYGGSAGGQNALAALLWHGDFYKAAAADCGCHDNRMDKIWWNELWMSWPVGPWYEENSNVANASRMPKDCKLLLTVGEMDENVDPASTMQVVAALVKADRDFELLVLPGMGHGAGESPYGRRRRQDFFVRSLMGREPRWE